jgi:hypothetical protein
VLEVRTTFLTPGWDDWKSEFMKLAETIRDAAPTEEGWVSVGERADFGGIVATIHRHEPTWTMSGWSVRRVGESDVYEYERIYGNEDHTPQTVAADIVRVLKLPRSSAARS